MWDLETISRLSPLRRRKPTPYGILVDGRPIAVHFGFSFTQLYHRALPLAAPLPIARCRIIVCMYFCLSFIQGRRQVKVGWTVWMEFVSPPKSGVGYGDIIYKAYQYAPQRLNPRNTLGKKVGSTCPPQATPWQRP